MSDHKLTTGPIEGEAPARFAIARCTCGAVHTLHEGRHSTIAFEAEVQRRASSWHAKHRGLDA